MNTAVNWTNPYANRKGRWLRGNLHTHTSPASGCGRVSLERTLELYDSAGYDFLSISDHRTLTQASHSRMVMIPGIEWNAPGGIRHTGIYSCDGAEIAAHIDTTSQDELLADLSNRGALCILNHPDWQLRPHYRREELEALSGFDGIEIFNGLIQFLDGYPISTDKWDYLLSKGKRVLGYANDDFHGENDVAQGWNVVRSESETPEAILAALKSGNFYASCGVELVDIGREGNVVTVESKDGEEIQVVGEKGCVLQKLMKSAVSVDISQFDTAYVRFTVYGYGSQMAWTQPFFLE